MKLCHGKWFHRTTKVSTQLVAVPRQFEEHDEADSLWHIREPDSRQNNGKETKDAEREMTKKRKKGDSCRAS